MTHIFIEGKPYPIEPHRFNPGDLIYCRMHGGFICQIEPFKITNHYCFSILKNFGPKWVNTMNVKYIGDIDLYSNYVTDELKAGLL